MIAINQVVDADLAAQEWALMRLSHLYAYAVDHGDPSVIEQIFTEDAIVEAPFKVWNGWAELRGMCTTMKETFISTMHSVHNQIARVDGELATGETYCVAYHVMDTPRGGPTLYEAGVVYQNKWRRSAGLWRFASRAITINWTSVKPVRLASESFQLPPRA